MSETLEKNVQEMLNEEKWTRATLSNYSIGQFKELDAVLKTAREERALDELKTVCDEHLVHTKNSIIALYFSGMIALSRQLIDDSALVNLITIFVDNHKWNIVQYLCERILDYGESKYALRMLAECYRNANDDEAVFSVWERLVKVDYEEADIAKALAEHYEKKGDQANAVDFFKKALHRYVNKKLFTNVREIWSKLIGYCPEEIDFFLHVQKKVAKNISDDKAALLLQELYAAYRKREDIDTTLSILKLVLSYDERDSWARKEIVECFREKFLEHSQLEEYIRLSNLTQSWRNVHEAIADFEKHIAFDTGNFVFHRTWGVGRIASVKGDEIVIDFAKKREHPMSLKMAVNALQTLNKNHIWVLKATWKKEKLRDKIKAEPSWALATIIRSYDNSCDIKHVKAELVPSVLTASEWTTWSTKARDILKTDPSFGVNPENIDLFMVRDRPISVEEKLFNEFKAEKNFFDRVQTIRAFAALKDAEPDSEFFGEMFSYFVGWIKSYSQANENVVASYLLVKNLVSRFPYLNNGMQFNFVELFDDIDDIVGTFTSLKDSELKRDFLNHLKMFMPNWEDIYLKLFPFALMPVIVESLKSEGFEDKLVTMVQNCFDNYREYRESVVWIFRNLREEPWFERTGLSYEKLLIVLVHVMDLTYREIENHHDTTENRKINKQVQTILFKEGVIDAFLDAADTDTITRIYTLVDDVKDLDPAIKMRLRNRIIDKRPTFKFYGVEEKAIISRGLIVTSAKYHEKQKLLQHIMEVDVPTNSKEIGSAIALGDLRENAEYKAAKEKQEILNATVAKLKDEIERAQLFDPSTINTSRVAFGTIVHLFNETTDTEETYTILGPWESDPENDIISYLSPFGGTILNKRVNEVFDFTINDETLRYKVREISIAKI
ncbi:MAG: transcription elongation factor GreA [Treponema sp. GWB1_62_6]|nr:MAG: transcription elongation factor GreA [Treponema sp. GWA1_62_8]OHE67419.1 MAG: transcription elongation factor GreA [Treponema sp. GWC1_61_84]OHE69204.1 MAG: transcription elongation factor GreA [Treponema sp. GWB1_62_6]OHE69387.1 MAG: transcription elongation factor GreA [Treponema sp. RIFOXYC1_FULL_61_9]HCM28355.1 transcription elongation factor GreA [Treponema sp.]